MKNFAIIGVAGYIAPRHLEAIKETGNHLLAAYDLSDSVGILDSYFPKADFFTEYERFDRHLELLKRKGQQIDYLVVCSPNYLHDAHIRLGLRLGGHVICEKPVVLNPWNLDALIALEQETGNKVYPILQFRHHAAMVELKKYVDEHPDEHFSIQLNYQTPRGNWYFHSWKGDEAKSGGITSNIGVHFFDLFTWLFGDCREIVVDHLERDEAVGKLKFLNADVGWKLSIRMTDPEINISRQMICNGREINLNATGANLHIENYKAIMEGKSAGLGEIRELTRILYEVRKK